MRYAVVVDEHVVNVIIWDGAAQIDIEGQVVPCGEEPVDIGWRYNGTGWISPPPVLVPGPEEEP